VLFAGGAGRRRRLCECPGPDVGEKTAEAPATRPASGYRFGSPAAPGSG